MVIVSREEQREEQFLLRVKDDALAASISKALLESEKQANQNIIDLEFYGERTGILTANGVQYPVVAQQLPAVVESYKTYDHVNLVKSTDIGQVLLVYPPGTDVPAEPAEEATDGLTPAMVDTRRRQFKPTVTAPAQRVTGVEKDIYATLNGKAPRGVEFIDVEEELKMVDGKLRWVPVPKQEQPPPEAAQGGAGAAEEVLDLDDLEA